jgi:hypothetical protein
MLYSVGANCDAVNASRLCWLCFPFFLLFLETPALDLCFAGDFGGGEDDIPPKEEEGY